MANNSKPVATGLSIKPLYLQVRDALAERIATGAWKPGTAIPNEADLARELGVSPGTVRKALEIMEHQRLVTRRQGRGTFVNDQSSDELSQRFINVRGPNGERIVGDVKSVEATDGLANKMECTRLGLRSDDKVCRMRRVRFVDEQPFILISATVKT